MADINENTITTNSSLNSKSVVLHNNESNCQANDFSEQEESDITETRPNNGHNDEEESGNANAIACSPALSEQCRQRLSIEDSASEEDVTDEHSNNTPLIFQSCRMEPTPHVGKVTVVGDDNEARAVETDTVEVENQKQSPQRLPSDTDNTHHATAVSEESPEEVRRESCQEYQQTRDEQTQKPSSIIAPEPTHHLGLGPTDTYSPGTASSITTMPSHHPSSSGTGTSNRGRSVSNVTPSTFYSSSNSSSNHTQIDSTATTTTASMNSDSTATTLPPRSQRIWEMDRQASECRRCHRKFNFLVRRHHCRRCGQIVCDKCSSNRLRLPVEELIEDPMISLSQYPLLASQYQRVCDTCYREPIRRSSESSSSYYNRSRHLYGSPSRSRTVPSMRQQQQQQMQRTDSSQSLMIDCPVCGNSFLGMQKMEQEEHLKQCLNVGSPPVHAPRYIVYKLKEESTQIGDECPICFDEFEEGTFFLYAKRGYEKV
ncbi:hypothetical protein BDF20DRAFT_871986 [Mycotypha africana]|uniref:uncharacterized protein n=1 Tax=Mycotypha africana TaxID=64632 RepID=UPI002300BAAC|nr:uncharacterized protein BDF20DRAFT_871986 [Mycotypha africana]KAI8979844.1 hypothetical protein BDF20DRAFT_871986 [Mycotypha africana]